MSEETLTATGPEAASAEQAADPTLLTASLPDAESGRAGGAAQSGGPDAQGEGGVPDSPDGYSLVFDKSVSVDEELLNGFRAVAHEAGITRTQAEKLAELYAGHAAGQERKRVESLRQAVDGWEKEIKDTPGFAAQKSDAQRALTRFGCPELFQVLDESLLGSHPAMFRFVSSVGKALSEPGMGGRSGGAGPLTAEKIFYPDMS